MLKSYAANWKANANANANAYVTVQVLEDPWMWRKKMLHFNCYKKSFIFIFNLYLYRVVQ